MKRVLTSHLPTCEKPVPLAEAEAEHLVRVLRLRDGDALEALDGRGHAARVTLRIKGGEPRIEFLEATPSSVPSGFEIPPVTLEIAILKGDAMEWVIEKSVELGVRTLVPLMTAHTVVQVKNKGPEAFRERWQKIADQALKQCGRLERMEIALPISLENLLSLHPAQAQTPRLWFDEAATQREAIPHFSNWLAHLNETMETHELHLLVGPEGGWSEGERDLLRASSQTSTLHHLGLGPWILRAETAALLAISLATHRVETLDKHSNGRGK